MQEKVWEESHLKNMFVRLLSHNEQILQLYRDGFLDTEEKLLWMEYADIKKYMKKNTKNDGT